MQEMGTHTHNENTVYQRHAISISHNDSILRRQAKYSNIKPRSRNHFCRAKRNIYRIFSNLIRTFFIVSEG